MSALMLVDKDALTTLCAWGFFLAVRRSRRAELTAKEQSLSSQLCVCVQRTAWSHCVRVCHAACWTLLATCSVLQVWVTVAEPQSWRVVGVDLYHTHSSWCVLCVRGVCLRIAACLAWFLDLYRDGYEHVLYITFLVSACMVAHHFLGAGKKGRTAWQWPSRCDSLPGPSELLLPPPQLYPVREPSWNTE